MTTDIKVPPLGESVSEATVAKWFKKAGEPVQKDEMLVELETDKVTLEVNAPAAGVIKEIKIAEGSTATVGQILGSIQEGAVASGKKEAPKSSEKTKPVAANDRAEKAQPATQSSSRGAEGAGPAARKLIEEHGLNAAVLSGTGKDGRVTKGDILEAIEKATAATSPTASSQPAASGPREERVKMSKLRQVIAKRLKESQNTAAILTTFNECDMTAVMQLRKEYNEVFEKRHGVKLGFMSIFTRAAIAALKELPAVNAEIDGDELVYKNHYDIGIAVGTEQGLVVPVVRDADQMSLAAIEKKIAELGKRARDGKLAISELQGGTFTISNGGIYGSLLSTPIINPPQSGILGLHKIQERPMVINGEIKVRPMMYLALSYDHRIIDGREAVTFLVKVKENIEDPRRLLLDL